MLHKKPLEKKEYLYFVLFYFILSAFFTYPLLFLYQPHTLLGPLEDNLQSLWNPWHLQQAILESEETLFSTHYLFYPQSFSLTMHTLSLTNSFFQVFLNLFFPLNYCYNLTLFFSFVFAGYFNFLLCYELTQHRHASLFAGVLFSFCPYHIARSLHHINLASIFWFPLLVWIILCSIRYPNRSYYWKLTIVFLLIAFTDYYYFIFSVVLGGVFALAYWRKSKYLVVSLFFSFLFFSPVVIKTALDLKTYHYPVKTGYDRGILDVMSFFVPPPWHSFFGNLSSRHFYDHLEVNSWEMVGYLGYLVLALAIYGCFYYRVLKEVRLFTGIAFFSLFLSLGSPIHFFGNVICPGAYWFVKYFPILGVVRIPSRWMVLSHLALSVLASFGVMKWLEKRATFSKTKSFFFLWILIFVEYICVPLPYVKVPVSSFYETLANETDTYAVLNVPYRVYLYSNYYMYLQTVHRKPILFGQVSRVYREAYSFLEQNQLDQFCKTFESTATQRALFRERKIRYLVLHQFLLEDISKIRSKLESQFQFVFEDKRILVFRLDGKE